MIGTAARTSSWLVTDNSTPPECRALTMNFHSDRSPAKGGEFHFGKLQRKDQAVPAGQHL
jgi:hypothetical protein